MSQYLTFGQIKLKHSLQTKNLSLTKLSMKDLGVFLEQ